MLSLGVASFCGAFPCRLLPGPRLQPLALQAAPLQAAPWATSATPCTAGCSLGHICELMSDSIVGAFMDKAARYYDEEVGGVRGVLAALRWPASLDFKFSTPAFT